MPNIFYGRDPRETEDPLFMPAMAPQSVPGLTPLTEPGLTPAQDLDLGAGPVQGYSEPAPQRLIGKEEIKEAMSLLQKYKAGKANLEARVKEDEEWYKIQHWDAIRKQSQKAYPQSSSAWLFNTIVSNHADAMDNYPNPVVLPRERSDEQSAKVLSSILPTLMEYNEFEQTYSDNWWEKLKHGTGIYGVFWDSKKDNIGDVEIKDIDLMNIFWEPGIRDIQDSANVFNVNLVDQKQLEAMYPELKDKLGGDPITVTEYNYDDSVDTSEKTLVVDWYYKTESPTGKKILHYCKFCGDEVLFATENDPLYRDRGFYDHGEYPFVFDTLYPEKGTPVGFGYVAICKEPQLFIDYLSSNIRDLSMQATKNRYFVSRSTAINKQDLMDWNNPLIDVEGELGEERIRRVETNEVSSVYLSVLEQKINEMKETASNNGINNGVSGGVTAAASIAALQEAGNKVSRDQIGASYRAYARIIKLVIAIIKQFYDEKRAFRITGDQPGTFDFAEVSNMTLGQQETGVDAMGNKLFREPIFDLKIKAQKKSPFSRMEENERAKELYGLGFFNPERAQEALACLDMMDFEEIDKVKDKVSQGQTLMNIVQEQQQQIQQLMGVVQQLTGMAMPQEQQTPAQPQAAAQTGGGSGIGAAVKEAGTPMTSYGQQLAKRSTPSMDTTGNVGAV